MSFDGNFRATALQGDPVAAVLDRITGGPLGFTATDPDGPLRTVGVMVSSADGVASVDSSSMALGGPADRQILRGLRERSDVILVGATTLEKERYATVLDPDQIKRRSDAGVSPQPTVATISRRFSVDPTVPLFDEPSAKVLVFGHSSSAEEAGRLDGLAAVETVALPEASLQNVVASLADRGNKLVLCEGGPSLLAALIAAELLDEIVLTVSPVLVTVASEEKPTRILGGELGRKLVPMELQDSWTADNMVFLHYKLGKDGGQA